MLTLFSIGTIGCAEHEFESEWSAWIDDCVSEGITERAAINNLDEDGIDLVEDTCGEVAEEMSRKYQDVGPSGIPETEMDATFERVLQDCLNKDFLESDYCE